MSAARLAAVRGRLLLPRGDAPGFTALPDGLLQLDGEGRVAAVGPAPPGCAVPETWPGAVVLPGFVDAHVHFPQTRTIGSASGPLLDWLARTTFPEEARFAERAYAEAVATEFCTALLQAGTTAAAVYSSSHPQATDALFAALDRRGLRALAGLTLMDTGAPPANLLPAGPALEACEALIARWHGHDGGRLRFCLTPRFALSCTPELLRGAARLADHHGLWVQTHISENPAEIAAVAEAFPRRSDYLDVYAHHGLVGPRTLLAHCVHFDGPTWRRTAQAGAAVAHCPDSNFFLGSGSMHLGAARAHGVRVGLGTDVGAGRTFRVPRVAASAYDASLVRGDAQDPALLLWLATAGGADALGLAGTCGRLRPGEDADLVAIDVPEHVAGQGLVDALLFRHDQGPVRATVVRGRTCFSGPPAPQPRPGGQPGAPSSGPA